MRFSMRIGHTSTRALVAAAAMLTPAATPAQDRDPASIISRIEAAQTPNRQGFDGLTLPELMQRFRVPGMSIAVIRDEIGRASCRESRVIVLADVSGTRQDT